MTLLVDPPSGWMYGFPAPLEDDYPAQLRKAGYPEKDIPMALKHSRFMGTYEELLANREKWSKQVFEARKLPKVWKVGQKVRYITNNDWAWYKGDVGYVVEIREEYKGRPAAEYQVFYTNFVADGSGMFWTTPSDVELIEDVED